MNMHHDPCPAAKVPATVIARWPVGTFVENLLARDDGALVVSIVSSEQLVLVRPGSEPRPFARLPAAPTGMAMIDRELFVNVGEPGTRGWSIFRVGWDGQVARVLDLPDALFLNGNAVLRGSELIVVDSALGHALRVDVRAGRSSVWLSHELLGKCTAEPMVPGVNGVKTFGGAVYFTSTERSLVLRAKVTAGGEAAGLEVLAERFVGDDFALDVDGNMYITTHVMNQLQRLAVDGTRTVLAGAEEGMHGSTAAAFGRTAADERALYVTTTGGIVAPVDGVVREAKLVRLEIGTKGAPLNGA